MTIPHLLLTIFIYLSLISVVVGYAACMMAGRSDAGVIEESAYTEPEPVGYSLYRVQDEHLDLG